MAGSTISITHSIPNPIFGKKNFTNHTGMFTHSNNTRCFNVGFGSNEDAKRMNVLEVIDIAKPSAYKQNLPSVSSHLQIPMNLLSLTAMLNAVLPHSLKIIHAARIHQHTIMQVFTTFLFTISPVPE